MAAASVEDTETSVSPSEKESDDTNNQVSEKEIKVKLSELKVADLRAELEKRDLDKNGVKSVLIERLKTALLEEGKDVEECTFKISNESMTTKNIQKKDKIPDSETNGDMENNNEVEEQKSEEFKDSDSTLDDKASNEVTLLISIDEEEAQLNDDENLELNKGSDNEIDKVSEEPNQSNQESPEKISKSPKHDELPAAETTPSKATKITTDELKEKKIIKTPQLKAEVTSSVSPKVLKVIGKNDKIKSANVLAKSLWVTGLPNTTRAADLKALFSKHGKVSSVKIVKSTKQTPPKCYAFVTMATSKDATKAIQNVHRIEFNGRIISVERTQSEPSALLKKTESKVASLTTKKTAARKDASKVAESSKVISESKSSAKPEAKSNESKSSTEPAKTKESKVKTTEKSKSKEKEQKSKEYKDRDARRPPIKRPHPPMYKSRSFAFNDRRRYPTFRRPFGSRPFMGRSSGFGASSFRPRSDGSLYEKMREERIRRERYRERERREADRRREYIERKQREEAYRLEREKEKLRIERELLEREKAEILKLEREKQRLERERLEREREELRRQAELRRGVKRSYGRVSREVNTFWEDRKKTPRYEDRSSFHGEKLRLEPSTSSKYEYLQRERPAMNRHEYDRHSERFGSSKTLHTTPRSDFGDRDSRREVTIRSREENPVYDRNEFRDRDSRRTFPPRDRHSSRRENSREDWKHDRRVHERIISPSTSSGQRRMTYY